MLPERDHAAQLFRTSWPSVNDLNGRTGQDEPASTRPIRRLLGHDLVSKIPRKYDQIIRLVCEEVVRVADQQARARHIFALLVNIAINHVFDQLCTNTAVFE